MSTYVKDTLGYDYSYNRNNVAEAKKSYNGWSSYETWLFNLHTDGDYAEYTKEAWNQVRKDAVKHDSEKDALYALFSLVADYMEESLVDAIDQIDIQNTLVRDLLNGAKSEINFHEVATHYIDCESDDNTVLWIEE